MDPADTIRYYERAARDYAKLIDPQPPAFRARALQRLAALVPDGEQVLEIGSGTGRDADYLESSGIAVKRTDAAREFAQIQAERGKEVALLDVVNDDLGGPYGGVLALCVLMHVARESTDGVLHKIASAVRPGGGFLVSVREGTGATHGPAGMTFWSRDEFAELLTGAGFTIEWDDLEVDEDGDRWLTFLARR
jgi:2-polyprenyl-3-methyl-5-hydroxy-6-metoxy-1,4-benzoquinol methylase